MSHSPGIDGAWRVSDLITRAGHAMARLRGQPRRGEPGGGYGDAGAGGGDGRVPQADRPSGRPGSGCRHRDVRPPAGGVHGGGPPPPPPQPRVTAPPPPASSPPPPPPPPPVPRPPPPPPPVPPPRPH